MVNSVFKIVMFIAILLVGGYLQYLLYSDRKAKLKNNVIYLVSILYSAVVSYLIFITLPAADTFQRIMSLSWITISIVSLIVRLSKQNLEFISKVMISLAFVGGVVQYFTKIIVVLF